MADFHVVIDGLDLDDTTHQRINDAIQTAVLGELAQIDLTGAGRSLVAFRPRPGWRGLIANIIDRDALTTIPAVHETLGRIGE